MSETLLQLAIVFVSAVLFGSTMPFSGPSCDIVTDALPQIVAFARGAARDTAGARTTDPLGPRPRGHLATGPALVSDNGNLPFKIRPAMWSKHS